MLGKHQLARLALPPPSPATATLGAAALPDRPLRPPSLAAAALAAAPLSAGRSQRRLRRVVANLEEAWQGKGVWLERRRRTSRA